MTDPARPAPETEAPSPGVGKHALRTWTPDQWEREQGGPVIAIPAPEGRLFRAAYGTPDQRENQLEAIRKGNEVADQKLRDGSGSP